MTAEVKFSVAAKESLDEMSKISQSLLRSRKSRASLADFSFLANYYEYSHEVPYTGSLVSEQVCCPEKELDPEAGKTDDEESSKLDAYDPPDFETITTYDEYLDHYVLDTELFYFESEYIARTVVSLGFSIPELLTKRQFEKVVADIQSKRQEKRRDDIHIAITIPRTHIKCKLMQALADREVANRTGNMSCLIYVRTTNQKHEEVSGWIDFRKRLQDDGELWHDYFIGKRKLIPRPSDLCFYNWATYLVRFNSSENYLVTTDIKDGLQFMNNADRKLITVNPKKSPGDNTDMIQIHSHRFLTCMIYDHSLRIKA